MSHQGIVNPVKATRHTEFGKGIKTVHLEKRFLLFCVPSFACVCVRACVCARVRACVHACVSVWLCVCVCACVCVFVNAGDRTACPSG